MDDVTVSTPEEHDRLPAEEQSRQMAELSSLLCYETLESKMGLMTMQVWRIYRPVPTPKETFYRNLFQTMNKWVERLNPGMRLALEGRCASGDPSYLTMYRFLHGRCTVCGGALELMEGDKHVELVCPTMRHDCFPMLRWGPLDHVF